MQVRIITSRSSLQSTLHARQFRIYSCLNGFTLRSLVNEGTYDGLLADGQTAFVVDGLSAFRHITAQGLRTERICGRHLMAEALTLHGGPVVAIGGTRADDPVVTGALESHLGRPVQVVTPPMFGNVDELSHFATEAAPRIAKDALVLVFVRSPIQDLLAGELARRTEGTVFVNVGAVLDDIVHQRLHKIQMFSALRLEWLYRLVINPRRTLPKIVSMLQTRVDLSRSRYEWLRV